MKNQRTTMYVALVFLALTGCAANDNSTPPEDHPNEAETGRYETVNELSMYDEQEGQGHTGIGIDKADFFGFSMGANVALRIAIRHPNLVNHLVALAPVANDNVDPSLPKIWEQMAPENVSSIFQDAYAKTAPDYPSRQANWRS